MNKEKSKDPLIEALENYLSQDKSYQLYAYLINGGWGTGKTYFWKSFEQKLKDNKSDYEIINVSLFGATSSHELRKSISTNKLFNESWAKWKKVIAESTSAVASIIGDVSENLAPIKGAKTLFSLDTVLEIQWARIDFTKKIICFDDIERLSDKADIKDILGFIYNLTYEHKAKVVLIANEEEILKNDKIKKDYIAYKEKVIGIETEYKPPHKNAIILAFKYPKDHTIKDLVRSQVEYYAKLYNISNLRTVIRICETIDYILSKLREFKFNFEITDANDKATLESIILFITIITDLHLEKEKELKRLDEKGEYHGIPNIKHRIFDVKKIMVARNDNNYEAKTAEKLKTHRIEKLFNDTYLERLEDKFYLYHFFPSIYNYIFQNIIDAKLLLEEVKACKQDMVENRLYNIGLGEINNKLNYFRDFEDEEFAKVIHSLITNIPTGKYKIVDLAKLNDRFIYLEKNKIISSNTLEKAEKALQQGYHNSKEKYKEASNNVYRSICSRHIPEAGKERLKEYNEKNVVLELSREDNHTYEKEKYSLNEVAEIVQNLETRMSEIKEVWGIQFFEKVSPDDFVEKVFNMKNLYIGQLCSLFKIVNELYESDEDDLSKVENQTKIKNNLEQIKNKIQAKLNEAHPIKSYNLSLILKVLQSLITMIERKIENNNLE